jgi:hypothetical protein
LDPSGSGPGDVKKKLRRRRRRKWWMKKKIYLEE